MRLRIALHVSSGSTVVTSTAAMQYSSIILNSKPTAYAQVGIRWPSSQPWEQHAPNSSMQFSKRYALNRSGSVESSRGGFAQSHSMEWFRTQGFSHRSPYTPLPLWREVKDILKLPRVILGYFWFSCFLVVLKLSSHYTSVNGHFKNKLFQQLRRNPVHTVTPKKPSFQVVL